MRKPECARGFSLYELIMTLALVALVLTLGLPSFGSLVADKRLRVETDALFHADGFSLNAYAVGDVTGDGRADLYVGPEFVIDIGQSAFLLEGSAERWSGTLDAAAVATELPGVYYDTTDKLFGPRDIDGDGIDDLFLTDLNFTSHLFYGRSGLFADGFD